MDEKLLILVYVLFFILGITFRMKSQDFTTDGLKKSNKTKDIEGNFQFVDNGD